MPNTPFKPSWAKYEKDMASNNLDTAIAATDEFEKAKAKEVATSIKAHQWDKDRKNELLRFKPKWAKERRKKEQTELTKAIDELKQGGSFTRMLLPMPGYVIVEIDKPQTESGILIAEISEPNTGTIVATSDKIDTPNGVAECPVKVGDRILFKKYAATSGTAGLELVIKGKDYRLMRWNVDPQQTDILAIL